MASYQEELNRILSRGYIDYASGSNETSANIIIVSGSDVEFITTPMVNSIFDPNEIKKAINTRITELLPFIVPEAEDTVPRYLYNERLADIEQLQSESIQYQASITSQLQIINQLLSDSSSLSAINESLIVETLFYRNEYSQSIENVNKLSVDLGKTLTENIELKIQNSGLQAKSAGLEAERNSLITQVETLRRQVEGVESITSVGGEISGQLSVGIIPDEDFIGISTYSPRRFARSYPQPGSSQIESSSKYYTIKNASTDIVTIRLTKEGANRDWIVLAISGGTEKENNVYEVSYEFKMTIEEDLPSYMENIIGNLMKNIFINFKTFIEKTYNNINE